MNTSVYRAGLAAVALSGVAICLLFAADDFIDLETTGANFDEVQAGSQYFYRYPATARLNTWNEKNKQYDQQKIAASDAAAGTGGHVNKNPDNSFSCCWEDSNYNNFDFRYDSYFEAQFTADNCRSKTARDDVRVLTSFEGTPDCCGSQLCPYQQDNSKRCTCHTTSTRCHICGYEDRYCMTHGSPDPNPHYPDCPLYHKPEVVTNEPPPGGIRPPTQCVEPAEACWP